ncbi:hypothetical protein I316_07570 [Kwoniella heveanensis BCC8398]|uniref:RRM domain-containing protein n=1 Tax=Kwoniella heveanensis BCC8398 TaxID=1296120 RepID=A0A1B9GIF1_9TREE|nr:hypothetical protein I316_07570 [Kwoniella heveanensis BCC8398]
MPSLLELSLIDHLQYEADSAALERSFASYGEIKTFYDRIKERGIVFITFFDLRAAQRARDGLHGTKLGDRSIDVHYSLPRDKDLAAGCDRDKNQGSVLVFVHPPRIINEYELGRMCEQFGDIKHIKAGREPAEKIVEFFDSRGAALMVDKMDKQPFSGGTLELKFIWDEVEDHLPPPPANAERQPDQPYGQAQGPNRKSGEGPGYGEVRGGRGSINLASGSSVYHGGGGSAGGYSGQRDPRARSPVRTGNGDRRGSYGSGPGHIQGGPPPGRYGDAPPPPVPAPDDRLEQARKVQQLLASLGGVTGAPVISTPPMAPPPPGTGLGLGPGAGPGPMPHLPPPSLSRPPLPPPPPPLPPPMGNTYGRNDPPYPPPPLGSGPGQFRPPPPPPPPASSYPPAASLQSSTPSSYPHRPPPPPSPYNPNSNDTPVPISSTPLPPPQQGGYQQRYQQQQQPGSGSTSVPPDVMSLLQRPPPPPGPPRPLGNNGSTYGGPPRPPPPIQAGGYGAPPPPSSSAGVYGSNAGSASGYQPQNQGYGNHYPAQQGLGAPPPGQQAQGQGPKDVGSLLAMLVSSHAIRIETVSHAFAQKQN